MLRVKAKLSRISGSLAIFSRQRLGSLNAGAQRCRCSKKKCKSPFRAASIVHFTPADAERESKTKNAAQKHTLNTRRSVKVKALFCFLTCLSGKRCPVNWYSSFRWYFWYRRNLDRTISSAFFMLFAAREESSWAFLVQRSSKKVALNFANKWQANNGLCVVQKTFFV